MRNKERKLANVLNWRVHCSQTLTLKPLCAGLSGVENQMKIEFEKIECFFLSVFGCSHCMFDDSIFFHIFHGQDR